MGERREMPVAVEWANHPTSLGYRLAVAVLLAAGGAIYLGGGYAQRPSAARDWIALAAGAAAVGVSLLPAVNRRASPWLDRLRDPTPDARRRTAVAVAVAFLVYASLSAYAHDRDFQPSVHDENSYALLTTMLARGRLWMPAHPLADFFDTFHVLVRPVYASAYFPGAPLMYVWGVWLGLPTWAMPVCISAATVGLTYRVVTEVADGLTGLSVALLMPASFVYLYASTMVMANIPVLLLGLSAAWAWLRWRRAEGRRAWAWALLIGAFGGWAAVTRPVDAVALMSPVGAAMLWDLGRRRRPAREWLAAGGLLVLGAAPFLALQAYSNYGITGNPLKTPFDLYSEQSQPGMRYSLSGDQAVGVPRTVIPQKHLYYDGFMRDDIARQQVESGWRRLTRRVSTMTESTLPTGLLLVVLPVGLLALTSPGRWVLVAAVALLPVAYVPYPLFLSYYLIAVVPGLLTCCVLAFRVAEQAWPARRAAVATASTAFLVVAGAQALPEAQVKWVTFNYNAPATRYSHDVLPHVVDAPAVVLFRFERPGGNVVAESHDEPVYNPYVLWPDDAAVIRAHDLGPRNAEIVAYYGRLQPERTFYLFDRSTGELTRLGRAGALAASLARPGAPG